MTRQGVAATGCGSAAATGAPRPTVLFHVLTALWAGVAGVTVLLPYGKLLLVASAVVAGGPLGLLWLGALVRVLLAPEASARVRPRAITSWSAFPAAAVLVGLLLAAPWPLALQVRLSEAALQRLAAEVEGGRPPEWPVRVGAFVVRGGWVEEGSVLLETDGGWPLALATEGLALVPEGSRPPGRAATRHLGGRWWTFYFPD